MAAAPENGMLRSPGPPPLGAILVQRGLLTDEQLAAALAENKRTGEPTGEVIVRLGFATAATIAQALATQHGGPLKTEYGYAVGFSGSASPATAATSAAPPVSAVPMQHPRQVAPTPVAGDRKPAPVQTPVSSESAATLAPVSGPVAAAPEQDDTLAAQWQRYAHQLAAHREAAIREVEATQARLAELEGVIAARDGESAELASMRERVVRLETERTDLERVCADAKTRNAELERQLAELRASAAADDGHLAAATARVAKLESSAARATKLEAELAKAHEEAARGEVEKAALASSHESTRVQNADLKKRLEELETHRARGVELERQLEEATAQIEQLESERSDVLAVAKVVGEEKRGREPDDHADDPAHLLFVPGLDGYRLVERDGPPPAAGTTIELPEDDGVSSTLLVSKVGVSPLPGTRRLACAYLVSAA